MEQALDFGSQHEALGSFKPENMAASKEEDVQMMLVSRPDDRVVEWEAAGQMQDAADEK